MKKKRVKEQFLKELALVPIIEVARAKVNISRQSISRWRKEDPEFSKLMDEALNDGDAVINDMAESQHLARIRGGHYPAVRFHLDRRHPKYRKESPKSHSEVLRQEREDEFQRYLTTPIRKKITEDTARRLGLL